ncbi:MULTISPECIES: phage holin family protein [unclassified Actinotalea]|uniref:phage holin family protein n=1 Tax=unclassified Actinotalea TaxID=2638618 RepID=UPI0015F6FDB7|nr:MULTISPECIES: phage holin family protein [unclassified Actinotalea]
MSFLVRVLINAAAIWFATQVLGGIEVVSGGGTTSRILTLLAVALVFGLVNAVVKPVVALLSLPLYILTLGLFTLIVNALMLMLTSWLTGFWEYGLRIEDFGQAILGALLISVVSFLLSLVIPGARGDDR